MLARISWHNYRVVIGWFIFLQPAGLAAAPAGTPHAKVTLVSEQASVQPGQEFRVGLRFELEKDWHVYWINPGDSGEPPRVEWKLPPQFHAGPLSWPAPRRLENGPLVDYGYENEVLLISAIRAPADLEPGGTAKLEANIKWLVCHDICIPERQTATLALPIAKDEPKSDSRWGGLFVRASDQLPQRVPAAWRLAAVSNPEFFVLTIKTGTREPNATFFPLTPLQIKDAAPQQAIPFNQGIRLLLLKSDKLLQPPAYLKGILVLAQGKAYEIDAPVVSVGRPGKSSD
jgi:DsbC/DsbD-like thiol-disulfide interchange protein